MHCNVTWEPRTQCLPCGKSRTPVWKQYNLLNSIIRFSILYIFFLGNAILQVEYQCSTLLLVNKHPANADHSKTSSHYIMDWQAKLSTCKHVLSLPVLRGRSSPRAKMVHLKKKIVHQAPCKGMLVGDVCASWASGYFGPLGFFSVLCPPTHLETHVWLLQPPPKEPVRWCCSYASRSKEAAPSSFLLSRCHCFLQVSIQVCATLWWDGHFSFLPSQTSHLLHPPPSPSHQQ